MPEIQLYPRMLYRGKPQLEVAHNAGAEEHLVVNSAEEEQKALSDGYRLQPEASEPEASAPEKASLPGRRANGEKSAPDVASE